MINIEKAVSLLRICQAHMLEKGTYEEALTTEDLCEQIKQYFIKNKIEFKDGGELHESDVMLTGNEIVKYNCAMITSLYKLYPVIN